MDTVTICISFIVAILGIAYPILFQVVSSLDEKYSSILIMDLFNKEKVRRYFLISLGASLFSILFWILQLPSLINVKGLTYFIDHSAILILLISTILLIIYFFLFVNKILIYYTPTRFIQYLIKKHFRTVYTTNQIFFKAISDLLYYSIKQQNETIAKTVSEFLYSAFKRIREMNEGKSVEYPFSYYEVIYKSIEELGAINSRKLIFLENRTIGAAWLLGELRDSKISEQTYSWIWRNLLLALSFEKDDMIMHYWRNAHQFISFQLQHIAPKHSYRPFKVINEKEIISREEERERFLEFHYALGGLLLYEKRYDLIGRAFKYTTSIPPRYELLPQTMGEVFRMFIQFRDPFETKYTWISNKYYFPNLDGLHSDGIIKYWITKYTALLFLRQYSIQPYLVTMKPLELPATPDEQGEKNKLISNLDFFASLVNEILRDDELLLKVKLSFINKEWIRENMIPDPIELILQYKEQLEKAFEKTEIEQEVSASKIKQLEESSTTIIKKSIKEYEIINNKVIIDADYNNWFIHGERAVIEKSAFSDNTDIHHMNFDSFIASHIANKFKQGLSETFFYTKRVRYLLNPEDIYSGIDKLTINDAEWLIISFGNNLQYLKEQYPNESLNLNTFDYRGIQIIDFQECNYLLVGESFFILRKEELPNIIYKELDEEQIVKYSLSLVDEDIKLYCSVINLYKNAELRNELTESQQDKDLNKSVLINLSLLTEIRWKKITNCTMIQLNSPYSERGIPNNLKDIN
ncbi:MAG: hypothetical protein KBC43_11595 [Bacteroidales bacterium]|nr:hypothetical protein [Bacteroidales bacterium]